MVPVPVFKPGLKIFLAGGICFLHVALDFCLCIFLLVVLLFAIVVFVLYYEKRGFILVFLFNFCLLYM